MVLESRCSEGKMRKNFLMSAWKMGTKTEKNNFFEVSLKEKREERKSATGKQREFLASILLIK